MNNRKETLQRVKLQKNTFNIHIFGMQGENHEKSLFYVLFFLSRKKIRGKFFCKVVVLVFSLFY